MPKTALKTQFLTTVFLFHIVTAFQSQPFSTNLSKKSLGFKKEKLTHLHFYFHDIVTSRHPTAVRVAAVATTNATINQFGLVTMDDPLTEGPKPGSKVVGRAQGIYASAD
ncbi:hypothetical protein L6452_29466 [Arctium lappa]|uniref:Uncharacterized protein n=1 Tax=Arctium lappa TaxID=4217 RepID=A0ACB8ZGP4_ARCLA|nr:hypothetical protein L6452_29466 [Arctium lappa]